MIERMAAAQRKADEMARIHKQRVAAARAGRTTGDEGRSA